MSFPDHKRSGDEIIGDTAWWQLFQALSPSVPAAGGGKIRLAIFSGQRSFFTSRTQEIQEFQCKSRE